MDPAELVALKAELTAEIRDAISHAINGTTPAPTPALNAPTAEERVHAAETEYNRLCGAYETVYAENNALKQRIAELESKLEGATP